MTDVSKRVFSSAIDLLSEPVFTVIAEDRSRFGVSLAELLARLSRGDETELAMLMPHQQHPMHAFLVQLAALVCTRTTFSSLPLNDTEWRAALRQLAGCDEAFQLVVEDLSKPAFMQPPVPEATLAGWESVETPDSLDVLVTSKNHDVKQARMSHPSHEHWAFALVSLQTQQGFSGRDNYGIARMNGGFGSRCSVGFAPSESLALRYRRDVDAALRAYPQLLSESRGYCEEGLHLMWITPWDGTSSLALSALDPLFIEVCRRVRLVSGGAICAKTRSSKFPRLDAKELKGNTGDLWMPVSVEEGKALTLAAGGFSYAQMAKLLFDDEWQRPLALVLQELDRGAPVAVFRALVRGQGKTEGVHERVIHVPARTRSLFASKDGTARLGALAKVRIEAAKNLRLKVLKPALCAFTQGGADKLRLDDSGPDALLDALERRVDAEFFPRLLDDVHHNSDEQTSRFETWLVQLGQESLEAGFRSLPTTAARRERAICAAEGRFFGAARKLFPAAFKGEHTEQETSV